MPFEINPDRGPELNFPISSPEAIATGGRILSALEGLADRIDEVVERNGGPPGFEQDGPRNYLGASEIGNECWRAVWYSYRHAVTPEPGGRMRRLWTRGHREEAFFVALLKLVGIEVEELDPDSGDRLWYHDGSDSYVVEPWDAPAPGGGSDYLDDVTDIQWHVERAKWQGLTIKPKKQYRFDGYKNHFSGGCDGKAWHVDFPDVRFLVEFKTSNLKRFIELKEKKVKEAQPKHYAQMQIYMRKFGLPFALYCVVCKDDDHLYFEIVPYSANEALEVAIKAEKIIDTPKPPARISNNPQWFKCRFCDYRLSCQYGQPMEKKCRTCVHIQPIDGGKWRCNRWNANPPADVMKIGCDQYKQITD